MRSRERSDVSIVIPCFEQKRFLHQAIASAAAQRSPPLEIVVVDDGSSEDLADVVSAFPGARLIRQENRGLAAARNTGLRAAEGKQVIFLDADDTLFPRATSAGLRCFARNPEAAFVYGGFQEVRGKSTTRAFCRVSHHNDLVKCNWIGMIATVMFDRVKLLDVGGFDEALGMAEDWDAYLRLSRRHPFAAHANIVARYVKHDSNMSGDVSELEKWTDVVRAREWDRGLDAAGKRAWEEGEQLCRDSLRPDPAPHAGLAKRALRKGARMLGFAG